MDIGTVLSVVQTLLSALQSPQLISFCSKNSLSSQLDQLQGTVRRIQAVLEDAESKQVLSKHDEVYLDELKDVVFEADDLFDEVVTLSNQKKLNDGTKDRLLSLFTKLKVDYRLSHKIEKIKQKLDDIASRNQLVCFKHDPEPIKKRSRETCSYVHAVDIIGRDADVEKIVGMLLQSDGKRGVSFLSIVGIGGLGKTALAQLVFNDPRVDSSFSLKMWTCVSDQNQQDFNEMEILRNILKASNDATKEHLQSQLRQQLDGKYLLVLDDVWTENRHQWCKLADFLMGGQTGSWVVVTTRSKQTARIVGDGLTHELKGLSKDDSLCLFKRVAFEPELSSPPEDLVEIGQKIVDKCASVPLAIRVVGSLLYGQEKHKWLSFQELPLTKFEGNISDIMPILKLSYHQLESPLKSCFAFCAVFPKDYTMGKKTLLRLWMAQGYIPAGDQRRSMKDVAEEYFLVFLRRCFFQDVLKDEDGEIKSCKIHDLMHDVALEVAGKEVYILDDNFDVVDKKVRHIIAARRAYKSYTFNKTFIRSFLRYSVYAAGYMNQLSVDSLLANWKYMRILDLSHLEIKSLSSSIGDLLHLRYLDLAHNVDLKMLPLQITKLYNLETLVLRMCGSLEELPKEMSKLVNLRNLDTEGCRRLRFMPRGMRNLSCLEELTMFVVAEGNSSSGKHSSTLEDLKALTNLKDHIMIRILSWKNDSQEGEREERYLSNKPYLSSIVLTFETDKFEERMEKEEAIIEELHPHSNLERLHIKYYRGGRMPKWAREDTFANLLHMSIGKCLNLESLGCVSTLQRLKSFEVHEMENMKWLFEDNKNTRTGISEKSPCTAESGMSLKKAEEEFSFFPSLESLKLLRLPKLKGWRREVGMEIKDNHRVLWFPKLENLEVRGSPNLALTLGCPALKRLELKDFSKDLGINSIRRRKIEKIQKEGSDEIHKLGDATSTPNIRKLRNIDIGVDNLGWLNWQHIPMEEVESLCIVGDKKLVNLEEGREIFRRCSSSLLSLEISDCIYLQSVSGGLEHLTSLETLKIDCCSNLRLEEEANIHVEGSANVSDSGMPWQSLNHSLRNLELVRLPQLVNLPSWIQLTALQSLKVIYCTNLKLTPSCVSQLSSLRKLILMRCPGYFFIEDCKQLNGGECPHIQRY